MCDGTRIAICFFYKGVYAVGLSLEYSKNLHDVTSVYLGLNCYSNRLFGSASFWIATVDAKIKPESLLKIYVPTP